MTNTNEFNNCSIYKLFCKNAKIQPFYIGATKNLITRKAQHYYSLQNPLKDSIYLYQFIKDYGGMDNFEFVELENIKCNSRKELNIIERKYIDFYKPQLNKVVPCRTRKEYNKANKEQIRNSNNKCNLKNREKNNAKKRQKYNENKEYYQLKQKEYYESNRKKVIEYRRTSYNRICGSNIKIGNRKKHINNGLHKRNMIKIISEINNGLSN